MVIYPNLAHRTDEHCYEAVGIVANIAADGLCAQQPSRQHRLHITTPVSNQIDDDLAACDTVDQAVRLEEGLAVFLDSQYGQLFREAATLWKFRQTLDNRH